MDKSQLTDTMQKKYSCVYGPLHRHLAFSLATGRNVNMGICDV